MKRFSYLTVLILAAYNLLMAVNARTTPFDVVQPDGTILNVRLVGDERFHFFVTSDGIPLVQGEDSFFYYATDDGTDLKKCDILATEQQLRSPKVKKLVTLYCERALNRIRHKMDSVAEVVSRAPIRVGDRPTNPLIGKKKGLVILVNFADHSMYGDDPQSEFNSRFNEVGFSRDNHIGSVHDYFYDQSYGKFDLTFDVIGPVTVSRELAYYGRNSAIGGNDINVGWMVKEACELADPYVNYNDYDWDGDGEAEQVYLVYAGYGEASGAPSYTIWPHKYSLSSALDGEDGTLLLDGVKIDTYACSCEFSGTRGNKYNGIGTACHEFSHCLGLPDIYDVAYNGGFAMSYWDIMSSGSYGGPEGKGEIPCGYSAYERWYAGWLEYEELTDMSRIYGMPCIGDEPKAYIIYNDNDRNEYFVLENRQNRDWFSYVGKYNNCHGLMITHIDYDFKAWTTNRVNVFPSHQRYNIVPADNSFGRRTVEGGTVQGLIQEDFLGDLFPGSENVTVFDNDSHRDTGGRLFNKNTDDTYNLNKPVTNIKEIDGLISFDFMGGIYVAPPVMTKVEAMDDTSVSVSWVEQPDIESYMVECRDARKTLAESLVFSEFFERFVIRNDSSGVENDLSRLLGFYTEQGGWSGKCIYRSAYGAKVGNDSIGGFIQTPVIPEIEDVMTLKLIILPVGDSNIRLKISLLSEESDTIDSRILQTSDEKTTYVIPYRNIASANIRIEGEKPFYLTKLQAYNEYYTESELWQKEMENLLTYQEPPITIDNCKGGNCVITGLSDKKYKVRIKAYKDEAWSEWSESMEIDMSEPTSATDIFSPQSEPQRIYDINGMEVKSIHKKGVYILDYGTMRKKVLIQ